MKQYRFISPEIPFPPGFFARLVSNLCPKSCLSQVHLFIKLNFVLLTQAKMWSNSKSGPNLPILWPKLQWDQAKIANLTTNDNTLSTQIFPCVTRPCNPKQCLYEYSVSTDYLVKVKKYTFMALERLLCWNTL